MLSFVTSASKANRVFIGVAKRAVHGIGLYCMLVLLAACGGGSRATSASSAADHAYADAPAEVSLSGPLSGGQPGEVTKMESVAFRDARVRPPSAPAQAEPASPAPPDGAVNDPESSVKRKGGVPSAEANTSTQTNSGVVATDKPNLLLIYQAQLTLAVYEVARGLDAVEALAQKAGGYLVSRNMSTIVVRVPAAGFDASFKSILGLGDVLARNLQVEDVTAKVRDLEVRLKNAEVVRQRLTELLSGAKNTEDALEVERELGRVTDNIEQMKSQLKLMNELVAFSTITVRFDAPKAEHLDKRFKLPFPWLEDLGLSNLLRL